MRVGRRYLITGRVQGVGFRFFAEAAAAREGLSGSARNLADDRVEIMVEGEAEAVERFERHVRHGPPLARVSQFEVEDITPAGLELGFRVR